jgi:hypothetical protein
MDGKKDKDNVYLTVSVLPFHPHTLGPEGRDRLTATQHIHGGCQVNGPKVAKFLDR